MFRIYYLKKGYAGKSIDKHQIIIRIVYDEKTGTIKRRLQ